MTDDSQRGRFTWHELMTPNPGGAREFYSTVIGWTAGPIEGSHSTFTGPAGPLGGYSERSPAAVPRWIPFLSVADADEALRVATDLGAGVVVQPTTVDQGGRYAVLTDPQGAAFGIYSGEDIGPDRNPDPGEFSWHELATSDWRAAFDFYRELFGWERIAEHDMGPMGIYMLFGRGDKQLGGMFNKSDTGQAGEPAWLSYVRVSDLSRTVEKVKAARGSVLTGPMEVPGGDWIAQLLDPYGAAFAVHALAADVKAQDAEKRTAGDGASAPRDAKAEVNAEGTITEIWSGAEASAASKAGKKKPSTKKGKAAKSKTTKTKAKAKSKPAKAGKSAKKAGKAAKKKSAAKKAGGKKAGGKKAAKKAAKKKAGKKKTAAGKKAGKKRPAKKTAKKATKKKTAKRKTGKRSAKKPGPAGRKKSKSAGRAKKAGKKKAGKKKTGKKKARG